MSTTTAARRRGSTGRRLLFVLAGVGLAFIALTFFWFVAPAVADIEEVGPADAVVVFVGDPDRLDTAVELMERGAAENLVIPNGRSGETRTAVCDESEFNVFCPDTETIDTQGEARAIGQIAEQQGWSSLIAVTSRYHVHRATYQLATCYDGAITAVAAETELGRRELLRKIAHEWAGTLAAMTIQRGC
jgi:uncharacterized SAM-binding protein YcdF (DUF218 family)